MHPRMDSPMIVVIPVGTEGSKLGCPGWTGAGNEHVGAGGSWDLTGPPSSSGACVPHLPDHVDVAASW